MIYLQNNRIKYIGEQTFPKFCQLTDANFANNEISWPVSADTSPFANCHRLKNFNFSNNNINKIYGDWKSLKQLEILDLSHNSFTYLNISVNINFYTKVEISIFV